MGQKKRDYGLILSLGLIIAVGSYWLIKELPVDGIEYYVEYLGEKLVNLVPKEQEKQEVAQIYEDFKNKVREKKIKPENVEQIAAAIINLSNTNDTLSLAEAEKLMQMALIEIPLPSDAPEIVDHPEPTPEEWEDLNERLSTVYKLDERLTDQEIIIKKTPAIKYRVDENLNIIIDNKVRPDLENEEVLLRLEEDKRLIWMDNMEEELNKSLVRLELQLQVLSKNREINESLLKAKILTHPESGEVVIVSDSLELVTIVHWDSLENQIRHELEQKRKEIERAKASAH